MSGGVDSSVAALLLKRAGYDVRGVYMKEWAPPGIACEAGSDRAMAARVAAHLNIPFEVWDFRRAYKKQVADYMLREYKAGRTPNPDVMCNRDIKFGVFLKRALARGADYITTGHYARVASIADTRGPHAEKRRRFVLRNAKDTNKDQTYFLWMLTQDQLKHCLFPIGDYTKQEVRALAKKYGLPNWDKKDSQGVCFIGKLNFGQFLRKYLPHKKGNIVTTNGKVIGEHDGTWFYTIGQRRGLTRIMNYESRIKNEKGDMQPYYVIGKDRKKNIIIVAEESSPHLYQKELIATNAHWISGITPKFPLACKARIRYRQLVQQCAIESRTHADKTRKNAETKNMRIIFRKVQRAVAPGQSIVFYKRNEMLGGGIIA